MDIKLVGFARIEEYREVITPHNDKYKAGAGKKGLEAGMNGDQQGVNRAVGRRVLVIKLFIKRRRESVEAQ